MVKAATVQNGKVAKREVVTEAFTIPRLEIRMMELRLVGDSPLISHRWSEKAKAQMLRKQMKEASPGRTAKNPEQDYRESLYEHPEGGFGFPCTAFKAAAVGACRYVDGISMTEARGAFHVVGELTRLEGEPSMREDMVRLETGTADIRYRGEFKEWATTLTIRYNARALSAEQIINLFNIAGFAIGVGEWRPMSKKGASGSYGMWHVE